MIAPAGFDKHPDDDQAPEVEPHDTHCDPEELDGSHVISKATTDCWTYLVVLRNGLSIICSEMTKRGKFLHLDGIEKVSWPNGRELAEGEIFYGRGIEVRLAHISMVVDQDS